MNLLKGDRMDKTPKMVESKLSCAQTRSKQLPGACPECQALATQEHYLTPRTRTQNPL